MSTTFFRWVLLDHELWFIQPFRADEWRLYNQTSLQPQAGPALTQDKTFDRNRLIFCCKHAS
ncbi:hypothetical protein [Mycobacterium leprae]|uniref:hypothetical protein n=1 Tax=Mycobacterium leprae TaxID=1769 RepID=UPI0002DB0319